MSIGSESNRCKIRWKRFRKVVIKERENLLADLDEDEEVTAKDARLIRERLGQHLYISNVENEQ